MYHKSLEDFINSQRIKLAEERFKLGVISCEIQENRKNNVENLFESHSNNREDQTCFSEQTQASDDLNEDEQNMLNIGEFSPNNPKMRVATQPYLGLGEYDHRRQFLNDQRKAEYQQYTEKVKRAEDQHTAFIKSNFRESRLVANGRSNSVDKAVQTDIKNVNSKLVYYEVPDHTEIEMQKNSKSRGVSNDKVQIQTPNNVTDPSTGYSKYMDRIGAVTNTSPRAKLMADLQSSCFPSAMGYLPPDTVDDERFEKVRKQEKYLAELLQQVEEKKKLLKKHKEEEKHENDLETVRMETQMRNLNFNQKEGGHSYGRHCYSSDFPSSDFPASINSQGYDNKSDQSYNRNKRMNEKRLNSRATHYSDTSKYTNSPPLSKRDKTKPPYSFNISPNSVFANSVPVKKRNSKLILNINNRDLMTTKYNQSRLNYANTNKLEESLPIPVLKAQSPVAKELINALPVQSRTSDAMRKLEDKWQIPAVQKNIIKTYERPVEGNNQGVLTQLGAIRLQLQQEQLRLDETLRKRGTSQSQQTIYADIHRNLN